MRRSPSRLPAPVSEPLRNGSKSCAAPTPDDLVGRRIARRPYPPADQMSYRQARSGGAVHPPVRRRNYPSMRTRHSFPRQAREHGHVSCWRITACGPARPLLSWLDDRSRLAPLPLMAATACRTTTFPFRLSLPYTRGNITVPPPTPPTARQG